MRFISTVISFRFQWPLLHPLMFFKFKSSVVMRCLLLSSSSSWKMWVLEPRSFLVSWLWARGGFNSKSFFLCHFMGAERWAARYLWKENFPTLITLLVYLHLKRKLLVYSSRKPFAFSLRRTFFRNKELTKTMRATEEGSCVVVYLGICSVIETFKRTKANCVRFPRLSLSRLLCVSNFALNLFLDCVE